MSRKAPGPAPPKAPHTSATKICARLCRNTWRPLQVVRKEGLVREQVAGKFDLSVIDRGAAAGAAEYVPGVRHN